MARPWDAKVVTLQVPTSTGLVDVTWPGVGAAPIAAQITLIHATANSTASLSAGMAWGVASSDGREHCASAWSRTGQLTSICFEARSQSFLTFYDPATSAIEVEADVNAFITDGVRLNFTTVGSAYRIAVALFFGTGTQATAFFGGVPSSGSPVTVTTGFSVDMLMSCDVPAALDTATADMHKCFGISTISGGVPTNTMAAIYSEDGQATSDCDSDYNETVLARAVRQNVPIQVGGETNVGNFTATGFELQAATGQGRALIGLAFSLPSGIGVENYRGTFPTSTGASVESISGSFTPGFAYFVNARPTTVGIVAGGGVSVGVCDAELEQYSFTMADRDGTLSTFSTSEGERRALSLNLPTFGDSEDGNVSAFGAGSFTVNAVNVEATGSRYGALLVEDLPFEATGAGVFGSLESTVSALLFVNGMAADSLPALESSSSAELRFRANADAGIPTVMLAALNAAVVAQVFSATSASSLPSLEAAAIAEPGVVSAAAVILPGILGGGTGSIPLTSTAEVALPALEGSGQAELPIASAAAVLGALRGAGASQSAFVATAAADLPVLHAAGSGTIPVTAIEDCVILEASRDQVVAPLEASRDQVVALAAGRRVVCSLLARYDQFVPLVASRDDVVDLRGSLRTC